MKEIILGGYNYECIKHETDHNFPESIERGIKFAIESYRNLNIIKILDLNDLTRNIFKIVEKQGTDEELLKFAKSMWKGVPITLDQLNLDVVTQDYANHIAQKYLQEKSKELQKFLETL